MSHMRLPSCLPACHRGMGIALTSTLPPRPPLCKHRYENFPKEGAPGEVPAGRFCAVVRYAGTTKTRHGGDGQRGGSRRSFVLTSASSEDQPLLSMNHSWFKQANCGAEIRTLEAELSCCSNTLRASADGDGYVWDHFRRPEKRPATVEGEEAGAGGGTVAQQMPSDEEGKIAVANQIPRWNELHQCLVMKFQRNRVKASSSKNFILFKRSDLTDGQRTSNADTAILQFGKISHGQYALDFRQPVAPLQAFALALSSFAFKQ